MAKVRMVTVEARQSHYVGDVRELEELISKGWEIVAAVSIKHHIVFTLVMK